MFVRMNLDFYGLVLSEHFMQNVDAQDVGLLKFTSDFSRRSL